MQPEDNSLEGIDRSSLNSSLETPVHTSTAPLPAMKGRIHISLFRFNRVALLVTVMALVIIFLIGGGAYVYEKVHHSSGSVNSSLSSGSFKNGSSLLTSGSEPSSLSQFGQINQLNVNGQLKVNGSVVLSPSSTAPSNPVSGEIYYNNATNSPYYYNGHSFVGFGGVTSLGGATGAIGLGAGLSIAGGNLNVSGALLSSASNTVLTSGPGIAISGSTISNTGVLSITSSNNSINVTNNNGAYDITLGGGGGVLLGPAAAQVDSSNNPSIFINKTGSGNSLELEHGGTDQFVVGQSTIALDENTTINGGSTLDVVSGDTLLGGNLNVSGGSSLAALGVTSLNDTGVALLQGNTTVSGSLTAVGGLVIGNPSTPTAGDIHFANGTNSNYIDIRPSTPTGGNATVLFPALTGGSTDTICVTGPDSNCGSVSGAVTANPVGTAGKIAEFNAGTVIQSSPLTDDGSSNLTLTSGYQFNADTISTNRIISSSDLNIQPSGNFVVSDASHAIELNGNASSEFSVSANGFTNTLGFASPTSGQGTNFSITVPDKAGTICLENDAADCGYATSGSGVTDVNTFTGTVCIQDATDSGSCTGNNVTIQNADTTGDKGIASFNSTNFQGTGTINTIQNIATNSDVQFGSLSLGAAYGCTTPKTGNLCLTSSGTVYSNNFASPTISGNTISLSSGGNNIMFSINGGAQTFTFPTSGSTGQTICTSGITCASGGGQAVILQPSGVQTDTGSSVGIYLNDSGIGGSANLIQLQTGGSNDLVIDNSGNANFSNTTTVATLDTNTITPTSSLTVGSASHDFTLQGNESSEILGTGSGNSTYLGFGTPTGNTITSGTIYYSLDNSAAANTSSNPYYVCTTAGNCSGTGGSVTALSGSTTGYLPLFSATDNPGGNLVDAIATQTGTSAINIVGNLNVGSASNSTLTVGVASSSSGSIVVNNNTNGNSISIVQPSSLPGSAVTIHLPNSSGTFADSATGPIVLDSNTGVISCPTCGTTGGGGGANVVTSLNGLQGGVFVTDSLGNQFGTSGQNVEVPNATSSTLGLVKVDGNNIKASSGTINTVQDIQTSSSPQFASQYLGSNVASGNDGKLIFYDGTNDGQPSGYSQTFTQLALTQNQNINIPNNSGTLLIATNTSCSGTGNLNISGSSPGQVETGCNPNFTTSVTTPQLIGSAGLTVTSGSGTLQLGSASSVEPFTLNGTAGTSGSFSVINAYGSGSNLTKLEFTTPSSASNVIQFPDTGGVTGTVCVQNNVASYNSCTFASGVGGSGSANQVAYFSNSSALTSGSNFYDNGTHVGLGGISSGFGTVAQLTVNTNATADNSAATQLNSGGTGNKALVLQGASGQTADLLDLENNLGSEVAGFSSTGVLTLALSGTSGSTAVCENVSNQLAGCGSNANGVTLQQAYDASTSPQIVLDSSPGAGGLLVRDNATPLGTNLFSVQNYGGSTSYLAVSATGSSIVGTFTSSGGAINLNASSNFNTNINTGTSTGQINIGNSANAGAISVQSAGNFSLTSSNFDVTTGGVVTLSLSGVSGATPVCKNVSNQLAGCGSNANGVTLQQAYDASTSPQIVLDSSPGAGGLLVRDNATPLGTNLFSVQNYGGSTSYLAVSATGTSVAGTFNATGTINTATISGGTFSGGSVSGGALTANGLTFTGANPSISSSNANASLSVESTGTGTLLLDGASSTGVVDLGFGGGGATTINFGNSASTTTLGGKFTESYSTSTNNTNVDNLSVTNSASSGTITVNGSNISLVGTNNASGANTVNGLNFSNVTAATNNTFNGINFGSGLTNGLNFTSTTGMTDLINSPDFTVSAVGAINATPTSGVALSLQGASGQNIATFKNSSTTTIASFDSSGNLNLGSTGAFTGNLVFQYSGASSGTVSIQAGNVTSSGNSYTLVLPTTKPTSSTANQCLQDNSGTSSTVQLTFANCAISRVKYINLTAEYVGAVLDQANDPNCSGSYGDIGTMVSGYNGDTTPQNFYQWTSAQGTANDCYDVVVQVPVPADWSSWAGAPKFWGSLTGSGSVHVEFIDSTNTPDAACGGSGQNAQGSNWCNLTGLSFSSGTAIGNNLDSNYTAGTGLLTIKLELGVTANSDVAKIGDIQIPYNSLY